MLTKKDVNMREIEAIFDGEVLRPVNPIRLKANTRVMVRLEGIGRAAHVAVESSVEEGVVTTTRLGGSTTTYLVIPEDADLRDFARDYWPKDERGTDAPALEAEPSADDLAADLLVEAEPGAPESELLEPEEPLELASAEDAEVLESNAPAAQADQAVSEDVDDADLLMDEVADWL